MGLVIFWSVIALVWFALAIFTGIALYNIKRDLSKLDEMSPTGFTVRGKLIGIESTLYKALKAILITEIIGFLVAAAAALSPIIFTPLRIPH